MPKITFKNKNEEVEVEKGKSLMEAAREKSWPIAFGCENAVCGTCMIKILEGKENISPISDDEKNTLDIMGMNDGSHRLACQCKINGDIVFERI